MTTTTRRGGFLRLCTAAVSGRNTFGKSKGSRLCPRSTILGTCDSSRNLSKEGAETLSPTREDMRRYRGILDALVSELEEDVSL